MGKFIISESQLKAAYNSIVLNERYVEDPYMKDNDIYDHEPTQAEIDAFNRIDHRPFIKPKEEPKPSVAVKPKIKRVKGGDLFKPKVNYTGMARLVDISGGKTETIDYGKIGLMKYKLSKLIEQNPNNKDMYRVQLEYKD